MGMLEAHYPVPRKMMTSSSRQSFFMNQNRLTAKKETRRSMKKSYSLETNESVITITFG